MRLTHKTLLSSCLISTSLCANAVENYRIKVTNNSATAVELIQGDNWAWDGSGELGRKKKITIAPYTGFSWKSQDTNKGRRYNIYAIQLKIPQQGRNIKNYSAISNTLIVNPSLARTWYYNVGAPYSKPYFARRKNPHTLELVVNPDLTISSISEGNYKSPITWSSDSLLNETYFPASYKKNWNNQRVYDDVYGNLWSYTPYDYFKDHPQLLPNNMKLVHETKDVELISTGHLKITDSYQLNVQVNMYAAGNNPNDSKCTFSNGSHQYLISGNVINSKVNQHTPLSPTLLARTGRHNQIMPSPEAIIRQDFKRNFPLNPESYTNWTASPYAKSLNIQERDLDVDSYKVDIYPEVINTNLELKSKPRVKSQVMQQVGLLVNNTPLEQTLTTSSYTKAVTRSTSHTLTHGWAVEWSKNIKIDVLGNGFKSSLALKYNGSVANQTQNSVTDTIQLPSQNIKVPSGCIAKADVILSNVEIDSDYIAYGTLDKNLAYKMTTPWRNMVTTRSQVKRRQRVGGGGRMPW